MIVILLALIAAVLIFGAGRVRKILLVLLLVAICLPAACGLGLMFGADVSRANRAGQAAEAAERARIEHGR